MVPPNQYMTILLKILLKIFYIITFISNKFLRRIKSNDFKEIL